MYSTSKSVNPTSSRREREVEIRTQRLLCFSFVPCVYLITRSLVLSHRLLRINQASDSPLCIAKSGPYVSTKKKRSSTPEKQNSPLTRSFLFSRNRTDDVRVFFFANVPYVPTASSPRSPAKPVFAARATSSHSDRRRRRRRAQFLVQSATSTTRPRRLLRHPCRAKNEIRTGGSLRSFRRNRCV